MKRNEIVHRLAQMIITLVGVSFLTFCLMYLSPGDPAEMLLEVADTIVSKETLAETRSQLGLDQPFHVQYVRWFTSVLRGDMGMSYSAKMPVAERLWQCLPGTLVLAGSATVMMLLISVPCGILSAVYRNRAVDYLIRGISFLGVSMPSFWVGLILLYVLGLKLRLFPIAGGVVSLDRMALPALTLAIAMSAKYTRQVRTAVLEVFSWPGLGKMAVHAIEMRDYPLVQGFVLWIAILYMIINLLVDISYTYLDPRLKKGGR